MVVAAGAVSLALSSGSVVQGFFERHCCVLVIAYSFLRHGPGLNSQSLISKCVNWDKLLRYSEHLFPNV